VGLEPSERSRLLLDLGRVDEAAAAAGEAIAALSRLTARDPSNLEWLYEALFARVQLSYALMHRGDADGVRAQLAQIEPGLARLLATPLPRRNWRIGLAGSATALRALVARTPEEAAAALRAMQAYRADVHRIETDGSTPTQEERYSIAVNGFVEGRLLASLGRDEDARAAWREAARRVQPIAAKGDPRALTLLGRIDVRLGDVQAARVLADSVKATSYRHPAYAELLKNIDQAP